MFENLTENIFYKIFHKKSTNKINTFLINVVTFTFNHFFLLI